MVSIVEILSTKDTTLICAPMVRYSGLAFRLLVRKHGAQIAYTPMIIADSFVRSEKARQQDFQINKEDHPLVVQFAAKDENIFSEAAELVYRFSEGVDLNCGCPQRWAMSEGYGASLLKNKELLHRCIRSARNKITDQNFTVSVKIRLLENLRDTLDLVRMIESSGASYVTVHARTTKQKCEPVDLEAVKMICESVDIPVVVNGDVKSMVDVETVAKKCRVKGVMCARGLLSNPGLFEGSQLTTKQCVQDWLGYALSVGTAMQQFRNHTMYMLERVTNKSDQCIFNCLTSTTSILHYLADKYDCTPTTVSRIYEYS